MDFSWLTLPLAGEFIRLGSTFVADIAEDFEQIRFQDGRPVIRADATSIRASLQ